MAALTSITAVRPTLNSIERKYPYGATIGVGQTVYIDSSGLAQLADANASATTAATKGIAITPGVNGSYGYVALIGSIELVGTTMVVGATHWQSPTAGGIDTATTVGDYVTILGTAGTATQLDLAIKVTGTLHA